MLFIRIQVSEFDLFMAYDSESLTSTLFPDCVWIMIECFSISFPGGLAGKEPTCQCRRRERWGFDPLVRKIPWERKCHLLQYSCLKNFMLWGAWRAAVCRVARVRHDWAHTHTHTNFSIEFQGSWCDSFCVFGSCSQRSALCDTMDCSMPASPVHLCLPEFAQIYVHWIFIFCCPLLLSSLVFHTIKVSSRELALFIRWPK